MTSPDSIRSSEKRLALLRSRRYAWCLLFLTIGQYSIAQQPISSSAAHQLLAEGKTAEAREAFEAILSADPGNGDAQAGELAACEQLALQARTAGRRDEALRTLLQAKPYIPRSSRLLLDLGVLEDEMRLFHDADQSLQLAEQLAPEDPNVMYATARVKMDLGQLAAAEEKMQSYLKICPTDASAHYGLGRVYQIGLQFDKAQAEFQRSIELQPLQTEAYYQLGDIALKRGDIKQALASFDKTLARDPRHGGALEGAGEAHFKLKEYQQAAELLQKAIAAAPEYPPSHYYLGLSLGRLGKADESRRELDLAAKLADEQNKSGASQNRIQDPSGVR